MKRILIIILLFTGLCAMAQETPPTGLIPVNGQFFIKVTGVDTAIWHFKGSPYGYERLAKFKNLQDYINSSQLAGKADSTRLYGSVLPNYFPLSQVAHQLGVIYNKSNWTSGTLASDFINTIGATVDGSGHIIIPTPATGGLLTTMNILQLNRPTALDNYVIYAKIKMPVATTTTYGIGLGTQSINAHIKHSFMFKNEVQTGGFSGQLSLFTQSSGTWSSTLATNGRLAVTDNQYVGLRVEKIKNVIKCTTYNLSTNSAPVDTTFTYSYSASAPYAPNTGNFSLFNLGGQYELDSLSISSTDLVNADLMALGDSKTQGSNAGDPLLSWAGKLGGNYTYFNINAGGGDEATSILDRMTELLSLKPKTVLLGIGTNDIANGASVGTVMSNIRTIYNSLTNNGSSVYVHCEYQTAFSLQALSDSLYAAFNPIGRYIDTYHVMQTAGSVDADNIHPSILGHDLIYKKMMATGFLSNGGSSIFQYNSLLEGGTISGRLYVQSETAAQGFVIGQKTTPYPKQIIISTNPVANTVSIQGVQQLVGYNQTLLLQPLGGKVGMLGLMPSQLVATDTSKNLVSSAIKTINSTSLLGTGDISLQTPLVAGTDYLTPTGNTTGSSAKWTTGRTISITGDISYTSPLLDGSTNVTAVAALPVVNGSPGTFGSSTLIPTISVNAKGLVTGVAGNVVIAPAVTLTGNTLASNVTASSLTSLGTLATLNIYDPANALISINRGASAAARVMFQNTGSNIWGVGTRPDAGNDFTIRDEGGAFNALDIQPTTGNVTLHGAVTGASFIKSGGTSSQFLMADGSVSTGGGGSGSIVASNDISSASGTQTVVSYTAGASNTVLRVGGYLKILTLSSGNGSMYISYTDPDSTTGNQYLFIQGSTTSTYTSVGTYNFPSIDIHVKAGSTVTVSAAIGGGTFNAGSEIQVMR